MHALHLVAAAALTAGFGWFLFGGGTGGGTGDGTGAVAGGGTPMANGHDVLVVTGDRDALAVTGGSHKDGPWAGPVRGLRSDWALSIRDAAGGELARVALDMSKFALDAASKGSGVQVEGCIVRDPHVAMLVSAPTYGEAASYVFLRGDTVVGTTPRATVQQLLGGGR